MEITQGNYGYEITFTVRKSDNTPENLAGIEGVKFQVVDSETYRNIVNGSCVITNPAQGQCKYIVQQGDFAKAGNFVGSLLIQYTPSKKLNTKTFFITVNKQLAPNV
jgi:hypothetical protein